MSVPPPVRGQFIPGPEHRRIVFLTGAGLSARTGLGTFHGPDGFWALHPDVEEAMHGDALPGALPVLWRVWENMARIATAHGPTPGHRAIARLGAPVITQNIDGLHQAAGSAQVAELHGSALEAVCMNDACSWRTATAPGEGDRAEDHGVPSTCPVCSALTRPDVVLFDEPLPLPHLELAHQLTQEADLFVVVGTSGVVYPAAQLAPLAHEAGATTVLIDIRPADRLQHAAFDHIITGDAHEVLPRWERAAIGAHARNPFLDPFD